MQTRFALILTGEVGDQSYDPWIGSLVCYPLYYRLFNLHLGSKSTIYISLFSRDQLLKERIFSSRSKLFSLRVDPRSKDYLIQKVNRNLLKVI